MSFHLYIVLHNLSNLHDTAFMHPPEPNASKHVAVGVQVYA